MRPAKVEFVFFDAGGGHRAAATALKTVIEQQGIPWQVKLMDFQEVLDPMDICQKWLGIRMVDVYNLMLKKGWTLGSAEMLGPMHWLIRQYHGEQVAMLKEYWQGAQPDLVVSVIPNFGRAIYESLQAVCPGTPLVTVLTDIADYPPHFWMEPGQDQDWICGSQKAVEQARAMGYARTRIHRVSGMVLHPRFYQPVEVDRAAERKRLGLEAERATGLILFGGQGSKEIERILERLAGAGTQAQLIAICGRNEILRKRLAGRKWPMPVHVEGFTSEIPYFMRLADFLIGKPGPGSISEAMAMQLPVIVESNAWTLPQERYNAEWVKEMGVGKVLPSFRKIAPAVGELLANDGLRAAQANAAKLNNRAVFEIPPILERLLNAKQHGIRQTQAN